MIGFQGQWNVTGGIQGEAERLIRWRDEDYNLLRLLWYLILSSTVDLMLNIRSCLLVRFAIHRQVTDTEHVLIKNLSVLEYSQYIVKNRVVRVFKAKNWNRYQGVSPETFFFNDASCSYWFYHALYLWKHIAMFHFSKFVISTIPLATKVLKWWIKNKVLTLLSFWGLKDEPWWEDSKYGLRIEIG